MANIPIPIYSPFPMLNFLLEILVDLKFSHSLYISIRRSAMPIYSPTPMLDSHSVFLVDIWVFHGLYISIRRSADQIHMYQNDQLGKKNAFHMTLLYA